MSGGARAGACAVALAELCACAFPSPKVRVRASELRIESGRIEELSSSALALRHPCIRATAGSSRGSEAEIAFVYRGPSRDAEPLASGEVRRQVGLKLRAKNSCNVLYVMWHLAPTSGVYASVKSNPGKSDHSQCGDRGYINLVPHWRRELPAIKEGELHTLLARRVAGKASTGSLRFRRAGRNPV